MQEQELPGWKPAHRELATMLGAVERGRDHCDAMLIIAALKRAFRITHIEVALDASNVRITTANGVVHSIPTANEEIT
jgi:hypothetical protein